MQFECYVREQAARHSSMKPQDVVKLSYQVAFGAEHLLEDREGARKYLWREYEQVAPDTEEPLYECISDEMLRVNLRAWKKCFLPLEWLFTMFVKTTSRPAEDGRETFATCIREAGILVKEGVFGFETAEWEEFLQGYPLAKPVPVHHSEDYRMAEKPAYRLVSGRYVRLLSVLEAAAAKGSGEDPWGMRLVVAIDGRCASGKTTLARQLEAVTGAGVVHMDDFFLPAKLRRQERLDEPGGNVHYERFMQEVLPALKRGVDFTYRCFDCGRMELGEERKVRGTYLTVVEGAYSCHPKFGEYMGLRVFCDVDPSSQLRRVAARDGEGVLETFRQLWIPLEESYFEACRIRELADIVV